MLLLLSCTNISLNAQEVEELKPVIELLKQLEKEEGVRFSYNRKRIKNIQCPVPLQSKNFEQTLGLIQEQCGLRFFVIDERYIAVTTSDEKISSLCGTLIDTATGTPLAGASVTTSEYQIPTGASGRFTIPAVSSNEKISIYYQGFKVKELIVSDFNSETDCEQIFVEPIFNFLPTVELNAYLTKGISRSTEGTVSISDTNFEIIPSLVEPDVLKIAQILPGVESFSETASGINIRGGTPDQSLLLWDDMRMYQTGHFFGLISAFNPNLTRNVNIYKNGTHPRYGSTVSGVISMVSDNDVPEEVNGSVAVDFTSLNGFTKIPLAEKLALHLSGRTSINTGLGNPVYNQFFDRVFQNTVITDLDSNAELGLRSTDEAFNFYDINGKLIWDLSRKDKLTYSFLTIFNKLEFTERFTGETSLRRNDSELKQRTSQNGLHWERQWSTSFRSKLLLGGTQFVNNRGIQDVDSGNLRTEGNEVDEFTLKADVFYTLSDEISIQAGYHLINTDIGYSNSPFETSEVFTQDNSINSNAVFINSKVKLFNRNTMITGGLRFTQYDLDNSSYIEPRVNLFQRLTNTISLSASYERKNQAIFTRLQNQDNVLGVQNERWLIADGNNNPILESSQLSFGASYKANRWILSAEAFSKEISGLNTSNQGFRNQLAEINLIGDNTVQGIEMSVNHKTDNLNAWLSYTYLDNEYEFASFAPLNFPANLNVRHTVGMAISYSWKSFLYSLGTSYHSGIPYTKLVEGNEVVVTDGVASLNFEDPNGETLKEFVRTDFSAQYTFRLDQDFTAEINLGLLNVFNRRNLLETYYLLEENENGEYEASKVEQFSLGFTPNLSLRVLF